jgi:hypothetical protein
VTANSTLIINEVFPNPNVGNEWVEIFYLGENTINPNEYLDFTISDEKRIIYRFQGDEVWLDNLLVVEVSGLNNDRDSVILKNSEEIIIDQMTYSTTEKDLSWFRPNPNESFFILGEASPLKENPKLTPTPILSPTPNPNLSPNPSSIPTPTVNPSPQSTIVPNLASPTPTIKAKSDQTINSTANKNETKQTINNINSKQITHNELSQVYFANYQNYHNLKITYSKEKQFRQTRLVFLGQKILKGAVIDAIIGSSLLVLAAILLSYEKRSKN